MVANMVRTCNDGGMTDHPDTSTVAQTTRVYIVTHNLTGYLPESSPFYTTDRDSAYAYALDEIDARVEYLHQVPLEYCDDAWQVEVEQITDVADGCLAARDNGDDAWSDSTIGAPYVTFAVESFPCDTAADLAGWAECSLADLELPDTASVDDVCDVLNQEGW